MMLKCSIVLDTSIVCRQICQKLSIMVAVPAKAMNKDDWLALPCLCIVDLMATKLPCLFLVRHSPVAALLRVKHRKQAPTKWDITMGRVIYALISGPLAQT